uniref:Phospholipase A2-like central domain-containing protein n=1 Tax=Denticeps clupeoides TaxID=299321 RepID=A0AAY4B4F6_9TELE
MVRTLLCAASPGEVTPGQSPRPGSPRVRPALQPARNPGKRVHESGGSSHRAALLRAARRPPLPTRPRCGRCFSSSSSSCPAWTEFAETDRCCRVHDHCPHVVHWHSICHCDCGQRVSPCLRTVNDTASRVVGQAFFNVIEVPCFRFSYEEQVCGACKRYDTVPVAVVTESVPYDFGGIEVIDELPLPRPGQEAEKTNEDSTQSLSNMVTAAEDFIKVLATVSTSQSSSADAGRAGGQNSDKKRKKDGGKKKKKMKSRKGKGRKKQRPAGTLLKAEDGTARNRTDEVIGKSNSIEESLAKTLGEAELQVNEELTNTMMRDDSAPPATPERGDLAEPPTRADGNVTVATTAQRLRPKARERKRTRKVPHPGGRRRTRTPAPPAIEPLTH